MKSLFIASTFAALLAGPGMATAQFADNPPGSTFQNEGIREEAGHPRFGEPARFVSNARAGYGVPAAYDLLPNVPLRRHQVSMRHKRHHD